MRRHDSDTGDDDGWTSEVSSGLALAGFLGLVFVAFTLLAMGPLIRFDAYFNLAPPPKGWVPFLHVLDRIGQRAVCVPILAVVTYQICRRVGSWRPALVAAGSVFVLNLTVLVLKVTLGRGEPAAADPSFFTGGMAYPSGHSSNIVLVYGLIAYLVGAYANPRRRTLVVLWSGVALLSLTMLVTSLTLNWHWFADLVAGLLVGGVVLELTATADRAVRRTRLDEELRHNPVRLARAVLRRVRGTAGPTGPPGPAGPAGPA
ncbi:phosphatase PAP2 family protein [Nocardioides sp. WL0053]|uniref:Phosphatase PAP2 family protein n=1 Tax=Nocardioides jiangsuensis TaxID=2866161 RepID=A0ABS7REW5_9ACTN|nr:phosphatase PAP2 family protein [Nocardioides jiangsuensis]MBY9073286.1 phosphatase PAP2 family protein [Nocardioides jiangsuensis]